LIPAKVKHAAKTVRGRSFIGSLISADRLMDDATRQPYYLARVAVDRDTLHKLVPSVDLIPGMPVEVLVVTERRTMLEYLAKPFREALWRSFREI
jgi:HlyD family secretion protein